MEFFKFFWSLVELFGKKRQRRTKKHEESYLVPQSKGDDVRLWDGEGEEEEEMFKTK